MSNEAAVARGRQFVRERFRWIDGAADTWSMFAEADSLAAIVAALAALVEDDRPDVVVGVEARGFVLGSAVAVALGAGFTPVRKDGALFPGALAVRQTGNDYRGNRRTLSTRRDLLGAGRRVVLVDDWIETGSQAATAAELVDECGGHLVSLAVIFDETTPTVRASLPPIRRLLQPSELRPDN